MSQVYRDAEGRVRCRDCGLWFDPQKKKTFVKAGYINQCVNCTINSGDAKDKYCGVHGRSNKGGDIFVVRNNPEEMRRSLKRANAVGFNANLPVGNIIQASSGNGWGKSSPAALERKAVANKEKDDAKAVAEIPKMKDIRDTRDIKDMKDVKR